ncbi:hypothetical protein [Flavobacterium aestivum]|uniref:hypothetical protein n=1 Tax=Flavobacterium aestivum TaxID=3003257 RepID=UPI002482157F|nr:hypothetical protein [Flavobacterium aestivum]
MKNKLQRIGKVVLCCFILIALSCEKDNALTEQDVKMIEAKRWFNQYESNGANYELFQNLDYDWNKANITKSEDGIETIIIPVNELKENKKEIWEQKLYLYKLDTGDYKALLFEIYPNKNSELSSQSIDGGDFNGYISTWDLKMGFIRAAKFVDNQVVENGIAKTVSIDKVTGKAPPILPCSDGSCNTDGGGGNPIPLRPVIITGSYTGTPVVYTPRNPVTGGTSLGGYTSIGGNGGGGSGITAPTPVQIINALTGKAKCLNDLLNKNGNSFVQNLLANFAGKSEFDIKIVSTDKVTNLDKNGILREINGKTIHLPGSTSMTIEISTSKANEHASLDVARTILHEYIHADIFRKLNTASTEIGNRSADFKETYAKYENQHGAMAVLYLSSMKEALKEFHKYVLTDDYNKYTAYFGEAPSDAFYEALAWGGLRDSDVKAWTDLSAEKKAEIEKLASRVPLLSKTVPCPN